MRAETGNDPQAFEFDGFELDVTRRRLIGPDGAVVSLQPRVFDLLSFLVQRPGAVIGKQEILSEVWPDVVVEDNSLNQAVSALRRALGDDRDAPRFIVTVPRRGYQFVASVSPMANPPARPPRRSRAGASWRAIGERITRKPLVALGVSTALVSALALGVFSTRSPQTAVSPTVAVLPFADMSPEGDHAYLANGLAEEILNELSQIDELLVIARTSSFAFEDADEDVRVIGARLGASHVLESSLRKDGERLRITSTLIDAATGVQMWSRSYDRDFEDVFAIEDEIATSVADALSVTLNVARRSAEGAQNVDAYDAYLRARAWRSLGLPEGEAQAVEALREAIAHDPNYVDALVELSNILFGFARFRGPGTALLAPSAGEPSLMAQATSALDRARAQAPGSWRVQWETARQRESLRDWAGAVEAAERAHAAAPATMQVCLGAEFVQVLANPDAVVRCGRASARADPLSLSTLTFLHEALTRAGRSEEAAAAYARSQELPGRTPLIEYSELFRIVRDGAPEEARAQYAHMTDVPGMSGSFFSEMARITGDSEASRALMRETFEDPAYSHGFLLTNLSRTALAYEDYELAVEIWRELAARDYAVPSEIWSTHAAPARRLPEFKAFAREMGFVDYWRASQNWGEFCRPLGGDDFECF